MKTSELTGVALDWAVCKAKGEYQCPVDEYTEVWMASRRYSTKWEQGGPIIERESIAIYKLNDGNWRAKIYSDKPCPVYVLAATPLVAAMRCYVASKLGYEVDIPEELTE